VQHLNRVWRAVSGERLPHERARLQFKKWHSSTAL
jgi:hypothetical protein